MGELLSPTSAASDAPVKSELQELVEFLSSPRQDVKLQAAQLVQGLTGTADGLAALATTAHDLLPSLLRLLPTAQPPELAPCALAALVNISQDASMAAALVDARAIGRAADYLNEGPPHLPARLLVMLLANLTTRPEGATQLVQGSGRRPPGTYIMMLVKLLLTSGAVDAAEDDPMEHVMDVLTNAAHIPLGRRVLLDHGHLGAITAQLKESHSDVRRRGAAALLRNICLGLSVRDASTQSTVVQRLNAQEAHQADEKDDNGAAAAIVAAEEGGAPAEHGQVASSGGDKGDDASQAYPVPTDVLAVLVGCLCGTGGHTQEPKGDVRELLAEAVLLAAQHPKGRAALWTLNAPQQLRKGYELEEGAGVCEAMEAAARLFMAGDHEEEEEEGQVKPGREDKGVQGHTVVEELA